MVKMIEVVHIHHLMAFLEAEVTDKTLCCILVDKEEIGSVGSTGMGSRFYENTIAEICHLLR